MAILILLRSKQYHSFPLLHGAQGSGKMFAVFIAPFFLLGYYLGNPIQLLSWLVILKDRSFINQIYDFFYSSKEIKTSKSLFMSTNIYFL